jgi:hypothetical protein
MVADGFNRRYNVRENTTSSVGTAHNQAIFVVPMELVLYFRFFRRLKPSAIL